MPIGWATITEASEQQPQQKPPAPKPQVSEEQEPLSERLARLYPALPRLEVPRVPGVPKEAKVLDYLHDEIEYLQNLAQGIETLGPESPPEALNKLITSIAQVMIKSWLQRKKRKIINELASVLQAINMCCGPDAVKEFIEQLANAIEKNLPMITTWAQKVEQELAGSLSRGENMPRQELPVFQTRISSDGKLALTGAKIVVQRIPFSYAYLYYLEPYVMPLS